MQGPKVDMRKTFPEVLRNGAKGTYLYGVVRDPRNPAIISTFVHRRAKPRKTLGWTWQPQSQPRDALFEELADVQR
jgi:hypothetical protein